MPTADCRFTACPDESGFHDLQIPITINDIPFFMAQLISSNITIAGTPIKQITSFQLTQNIFDHHYFRLVCPAESLEGLEGGMLV